MIKVSSVSATRNLNGWSVTIWKDDPRFYMGHMSLTFHVGDLVAINRVVTAVEQSPGFPTVAEEHEYARNVVLNVLKDTQGA